ncbi:MFS transporter [Nocardiopsis gilva YIM 90087]|uniref:MFS transporter n=2 Tax=Nocardiopsis gilva TaxID=280236 RepID=A0A223S0J3_9ACTN|nr:MFS transporter [Nocardiopsis gilva]ASU81636.1 MFS transporter [Nocardiopsis gilva YIM 90087]
MPVALLALALGAFAIGTTEVVIAGLLPEISVDFGISIPTAGSLVSGYALGMVVGAPLLAALGTRVPRKSMLVWLMVGFVASSLISALAPDYGVLLVGRVLSALVGGAYVGIGAVAAADVVSEDRKARAVAIMFMGLSIANVVGVPGGTALGQALGWRSTFWAVGAIGVVVLLGVLKLVPFSPVAEGTHLRSELAVFKRGRLWLAYGATALGWAPALAVVTYIAPMLTDVSGFSDSSVPIVLVLFGVGMVIGTPIAGRLADRALMAAVYGVLITVTASSLLLLLAVHSKVAAVAMFIVFGAAVAAVIPPVQAKVMATAEGAPNLASAANISAFNIGNAVGPFLGGMTISAGLGYTSPIWIAALLGAGALIFALLCGLADGRHRSRVAADAAAAASQPPAKQQAEVRS